MKVHSQEIMGDITWLPDSLREFQNQGEPYVSLREMNKRSRSPKWCPREEATPLHVYEQDQNHDWKRQRLVTVPLPST